MSSPRSSPSSELVSGILDQMDDYVYVADPESYEILYANKALKLLLGESPVGCRCYEVLEDRTEPCDFCTNPQIFAEGAELPVVWEHYNEKTKGWYRCKDTVIHWKDGKLSRLARATNITQEKSLQLLLDEQREYNEFVLEGATVGTWEYDIPSGEVIINETWASLIGYTKEEIEPVSFDVWASLLEPEDLGKAKSELNAYLNGEKDEYKSEFRMHHKDGHWVWILARGQILKRDALGHPISVYGIHLDINSLKTAEADAQKHEAMAERFLNIASEIIIIVNREGTITLLNEGGHRLLGYSNQKLIGKNWFETCIPKEAREETKEVFEKLMREEIKAVRQHGNPVLTKSGEQRHILWYNSILMDDNGAPDSILSSGIDITEGLKQQQELLKKTDELQRFNNMAVGRELRMVELKHEINELSRQLGKDPPYSSQPPGDDL